MLHVLGSFILARVTRQFIVRLKLFSNGYGPLDWNSNPIFYANLLLQKSIQSDQNYTEKILNCTGQLGLQWISPSKERANVFERTVVATIFFDSRHLQIARGKPT